MISRRSFIGAGSALLAVTGCATVAKEEKKEVMQGFDENFAGKLSGSEWKPFSDKKVRVGIAGEGVCNFGSAFAYQTHPNVEVVAVTDLDLRSAQRQRRRIRAARNSSRTPRRTSLRRSILLQMRRAMRVSRLWRLNTGFMSRALFPLSLARTSLSSSRRS